MAASELVVSVFTFVLVQNDGNKAQTQGNGFSFQKGVDDFMCDVKISGSMGVAFPLGAEWMKTCVTAFLPSGTGVLVISMIIH